MQGMKINSADQTLMQACINGIAAAYEVLFNNRFWVQAIFNSFNNKITSTETQLRMGIMYDIN